MLSWQCFILIGNHSVCHWSGVDGEIEVASYKMILTNNLYCYKGEHFVHLLSLKLQTLKGCICNSNKSFAMNNRKTSGITLTT